MSLSPSQFMYFIWFCAYIGRHEYTFVPPRQMQHNSYRWRVVTLLYYVMNPWKRRFARFLVVSTFSYAGRIIPSGLNPISTLCFTYASLFVRLWTNTLMPWLFVWSSMIVGDQALWAGHESMPAYIYSSYSRSTTRKYWNMSGASNLIV